ncbi:hypothetical protein E4O92_24255 [Massilia horti]|uniref:Uncharacterized protein n=2 Tax=Massilia horti TaxID=2562153 RepID=A0A4Y9SRM2_9BURK|nr:hypothetical protein E4O92_24255 [Massilia horti]
MSSHSPTSAAAAPDRAQRVRLRSGVAARAARRVLQWRLLALWAGALLLPTLVAALPVWHLLNLNLSHNVHAQALARQLDGVALGDLIVALSGTPGIATGSVSALILTLLLSPLLTGATITAARAPQAPTLPKLVAGAVLEYGRLLRMLVWALVPLALAGALGGIALAAGGRYGERAILPADAQRAALLATFGAGLLMLLAHATLDAGRAMLAIDRRRKSAVAAWWNGLALLRAQPLAAFGAYVAITVAGLVLAALAAVARINVPALGIGGVPAAFVLTQLAVVAIAWMRSARLVALMELASARQAHAPG